MNAAPRIWCGNWTFVLRATALFPLHGVFRFVGCRKLFLELFVLCLQAQERREVLRTTLRTTAEKRLVVGNGTESHEKVKQFVHPYAQQRWRTVDQRKCERLALSIWFSFVARLSRVFWIYYCCLHYVNHGWQLGVDTWRLAHQLRAW